MREKIDDNTDYLNELKDFTDDIKLLVRKINKMKSTFKSAEKAVAYYNLLKEDFSHLIEGMEMDDETSEILKKEQRDMLLRRREIKDSLEIFSAIKGPFDQLLQTALVCRSYYNSKTGSFNKKKYQIKTESGEELLHTLLGAGAKPNYNFGLKNGEVKKEVQTIKRNTVMRTVTKPANSNTKEINDSNVECTNTNNLKPHDVSFPIKSIIDEKSKEHTVEIQTFEFLGYLYDVPFDLDKIELKNNHILTKRGKFWVIKNGMNETLNFQTQKLSAAVKHIVENDLNCVINGKKYLHTYNNLYNELRAQKHFVE